MRHHDTFNPIIACRIMALFLALVPAGGALANSNFVSNPYSPYPPSCVRMPISNPTAVADTGAVMFHESTLQLPDQRSYEQVEFTLRAYRSPCSEPGRSLVWLEYHLSEQEAKKVVHALLPLAVADYPGPGYTSTSIMNQAIEPNSWGADSQADRERLMLLSKTHGIDDATGYSDYRNESRSWWFLLDVESPLEEGGYYIPYLMPIDAYNSRFTLRLRYPPDYNILQFEVPSTAEMDFPAEQPFPITGRLSGNWVIEDVSDQGFMLAISTLEKQGEPFSPARQPGTLVVFYSHYTFDQQGKMLWLTGSAQLEPGPNEVSMSIDEVTQGQFRGGQPAKRRTIGHVTLTANSCNDITLEYDYSGLGLGSGTRRLQRLFSLETAGFDCRDYPARVQANH